MKNLLAPTLACAVLAGLSAPALANETAPKHVEVAYQALSEGRTTEAVAQLDGSAAIQTDDPSALINLGTAYARQGRIADARAAFTAAMRSSNHYYLELADGRWLDSRKAARMALEGLDRSSGLALR